MVFALVTVLNDFFLWQIGAFLCDCLRLLGHQAHLLCFLEALHLPHGLLRPSQAHRRPVERSATFQLFHEQVLGVVWFLNSQLVFSCLILSYGERNPHKVHCFSSHVLLSSPLQSFKFRSTVKKWVFKIYLQRKHSTTHDLRCFV